VTRRFDRTTVLFSSPLRVANFGLSSFAETLSSLGVPTIHVDWRPPAGGDPALIAIVDSLRAEDGQWIEAVDRANREAISRLTSAEPRVMGIGTARDEIPGMTERTLLHAGPPVAWEEMCGPMRGAVIGGLLLERLATTAEEAIRLAASGEIRFEPCHHHDTVGPMAGVVTASMPVWIVENATHGNRAFATLNEGLGKVLRYGAFAPEVIARLDWMRTKLAPILAAAIDRHGPLDLRGLIAQALQMGDEGHNRNRAATSLLIRELAPHLVGLPENPEEIAEVLRFLHANDHFFLNLSMPAGKSALDAASGIPYSSLVTAMARNGTHFGIRISGTGEGWYTAPAPTVEGLFLPGFSAADAAPDIGDSAITETAGYGGFAMAAAPAIVQFVGGSPESAIETTLRMRQITMTEHPAYQIPALGFRGTPTGIDVLRVVETGIVPAINTGIAHKEAGIGMVGAGLVTPPFACFAAAARDLLKTIRAANAS